MPLTDDEAHAIAFVIATRCASRIERVTVQTAPVKTIVKERVPRTRLVEEQEEFDAGPHPVLFIILGGSWLLAFVLFMVGVDLGWALMTAITGSLVFFFTRGEWRRRGLRVVTREELDEEIVEREVEVTRPPRYEEHRVPSNFRVRALGRMRLTFQALPFRDGAVLVDPYGLTPPLDLSYPAPRDPDRIDEMIGTLEDLGKRVPWMLSGERERVGLSNAGELGGTAMLVGYERQVREHYITLAGLVSDHRETHCHLPVVPATHELWRHVRVTPRRGPGSTVYETAADILDGLQATRGEGLNQRLERLTDLWARRQLPIHGARGYSLRMKIPDIFDLWTTLPHFSSKNFYCTPCNAERSAELLRRDYAVTGPPPPADYYDRNTRLVLDRGLSQWRCPQCTRVTKKPDLQTHKLLDELFLPVYDRLLEENKNERLRMYTEARTRDAEYERDADTESHERQRSRQGVIESFEQEIEKFRAEVLGEEQAIESLRRVAERLRIRQSEALDRIRSEVAGIVDEMTRASQESSTNWSRQLAQIRERFQAMINSSAEAERLEAKKRDAHHRRAAEQAQTTDAVPSARPPETDLIGAGIGTRSQRGEAPDDVAAKQSAARLATQVRAGGNGPVKREGPDDE